MTGTAWCREPASFAAFTSCLERHNLRYRRKAMKSNSILVFCCQPLSISGKNHGLTYRSLIVIRIP